MAQSRKKGFTLIELIIGITILALLAVGLLAALDPAEQFAKARDTSTRNTLLEIYGAFQRYEAAQESYPGVVSDDAIMAPGNGTFASDDGLVNPPASGIDMAAAIDLLVASGELKPNFVSAAGTALDKIYIYKEATTSKIMTCFKPTARSFKIQAGLFTNASNVAPADADEELGTLAPSMDTSGTTVCDGQTAAAACDVKATDPLLRECCVYCAQ